MAQTSTDEQLKGIEAFVFGLAIIAASYSFARISLQSADTLSSLQFYAWSCGGAAIFMLHLVYRCTLILKEKLWPKQYDTTQASPLVQMALIALTGWAIIEVGGLQKLYSERAAELAAVGDQKSATD